MPKTATPVARPAGGAVARLCISGLARLRQLHHRHRAARHGQCWGL